MNSEAEDSHFLRRHTWFVMSLVYFHWRRTLDWHPFFPLLQMRQDLADNIGFGDEANEFHLAAPPGAEKWIDF